MANSEPDLDFPPNKLKHAAVLIFALFLGAICVYLMPNPLWRVVVALLLLLPILQAADGLGLSERLNERRGKKGRDRQYNALRAKIGMLLDVVRRLHWLAVDRERGIRSREEVQADMDVAQERLEEIIDEIRSAAGQVPPSTETVVEEPGVGD